MNRRTRARLVWFVVAMLVLTAFVYVSDTAMAWLRVMLHGR